jgi:nucleoside-diphosphate-sugar epimerase
MTSDSVVFQVTSRRKNAKVGCFHLDLLDDPMAENDDLLNFSTIYFLAAQTSTREILKDIQRCRSTNLLQTVKWLKFFEDRDRTIIFPSSSVVYGDTNVPPDESTPKNPLSEYAKLKAEVEDYLLACKSRVIIPRLSKAVSMTQPLFRSWYDDLTINTSIFPYFDALLSPLHIDNVSDAFLKLGEKKMLGVWNLSGSSDVSFLEYSYLFAATFGFDAGLIEARAADTGLMSPQRRPTLDTNKAIKAFGFIPPNAADTIVSMGREIVN